MAQVVRLGLFEHIMWADPAVGTWTSMGMVSGGSVSIATNATKKLGASGQESRKGGIIGLTGSATFDITDTNADILTDYAIRTTYPRGGIEEIDFRAGLDEFYWTFDSCRINDFSINWSVGEVLNATINWMGLNISESTTALDTSSDYPTEGEDGFSGYECVISIGGEEYSVQSFGISVNNNIQVHSSGDTKAAGTLRFPERFLVGAEELTLSVTTAKPIAASVLGSYADCQPDNIGAILTATNACSGDVFELTLTDLMQVDPTSMGIVDPNSPVEFTYGFNGSSSTGSLTMEYTAA